MWARVKAGAEGEKEEARHIIQQVGRGFGLVGGAAVTGPTAGAMERGTLTVFHS